MTAWLTNPGKKRRKVARKTARKSGTKKRKAPPGGWKAHMAKLRKLRTAKAGGTKRKATRRRRVASTSTGTASVAAKRKRARRSSSSTPKRRRRSYRRNPPASVKRITTGLKHAGFAVAGKAATGLLSQQLRRFSAAIPPLIADAAAALLVSVVADKAVGRADSEYVAVGAFMKPIESAVRQFNVPLIAPGLSAYPMIAPNRAAALLAYPNATIPQTMQTSSIYDN